MKRALVSLLLIAATHEISERYVFPDVAAKIATELQRNVTAGTYDSLTPEALAAAVSADLFALSHDKHLRLLYEPRTPAVARAPREERVATFLETLRQSNFGFARVEILEGNIGYIDLRSFETVVYAGPTATAAMNFVAHSNALIIDLRKNTGGHESMIAFLGSYLFDGDEPTRFSDLAMREGNWSKQSWTSTYVPGPKFGATKPVYILTGKETFSAAEAFAYDLKVLERATIVGEPTRGGANGGDEFRIDPNFVVWIPTFRAVNPITHANWEGVGVEPDVKCPENEALATALRLAAPHPTSPPAR